MPNKKYNEFPAGVYDTDKIFLQADAITGDLEKVNLPAPGAATYPQYYSAIITQSGTAAPVAQEVFNNTGETLFTTREDPGFYSFRLGAFRRLVDISVHMQNSFDKTSLCVSWTPDPDANTFFVFTTDNTTGNNTDGLLISTYLTIFVWRAET